jgi:sRNA-binding regulator protein Hfq
VDITIYLNNGMQFNATVEGYNGTEFAQGMNNQQMTAISIGDIVINKHAVMMIVPTGVVPAT